MENTSTRCREDHATRRTARRLAQALPLHATALPPAPDSGSTPPRLASLRSTLAQIRGLSFPRRFPIVQFPNLPLIVAFLAGEAARMVSAAEQPYLRSISYLAMTIWAYQELIDGVNWFRRLLGFTYAVVIVMRVVHAIGHG
jgi:hypothetical protein